MSVGCVHKRDGRYWCESAETEEGVRHFHDIRSALHFLYL
jgi:hypothetical protein